MLFANISRIVAIVALFLGAFQVAIGISIGMGWITPAEQALARYAVGGTVAETVDKGAYAIVFALALGTLAEIGISLRKRAQAQG